GCHVLVAELRRHRLPADSPGISAAPSSIHPESAPTRRAPHRGCRGRPTPTATPALLAPTASTGLATSADDDPTRTRTTSAGQSPAGRRTPSETTRAVFEPAATASRPP